MSAPTRSLGARSSSYLFAVIAGPYYAVHTVLGVPARAAGTVFLHRLPCVADGLPLGLYCRQKLAPYMDSELLFKITKQGLKWYGKFFAIDYPFSKYDQIFAPEFNQVRACVRVGCGVCTVCVCVCFRADALWP